MTRRLFALLFCLFMLLNSREPPWADAHLAYATTEAIIDRHALDISLDAPAYFFAIHNGKKYGYAQLGNALALCPSYLAYKALSRLKVFPDRPLYALTSHLSAALLMAGAITVFFALCRRRGASPRVAVRMALVLALCTICFIYARSPYGEALQTFGLLFLIERTLAQAQRLTRGGMALLGLAAGALFSVKLVYALALPLCAAYVLYGFLREQAPRRLRDLVVGVLLALLVFAPFVALLLWHNWVKTGSPFSTGYREGDHILSGDFFSALYGYLLSSGKGMFLYSPPLVLGVLGLRTAWLRRPLETLLLLAILAVPVVISAKYYYWHGDYAWGPRYMVPITPILLLLALPWLPEALARGAVRLRRLALGALLGLGLFVQVLGATLYWDHYIRVLVAVREQTSPRGWSEDFLAHGYFVPYFSPVWGHAWLLKHMMLRDPNLEADAPFRAVVPERLSLAPQWARVRLDYWPLDWGPDRKNMALCGLLLTTFAGGLLLAARGLRRRL